MSLEFTGELNDEGFSVTECIGGSMELDEDQLGLRYQVGLIFFSPLNAFVWLSRFVSSYLQLFEYILIFFLQSFCDPRLNFEQSLGKLSISSPV